MTLSHDTAGDGPALVFLHAGVCDRRMWDPQWQPLANAGYRVIRCDLRGFGLTPAPDAPYNNADDVIALLDTLGIGQAALVGASYGGKTSLEIAARHPERVGAMVLLCPGMAGCEASAELDALDEREEALLEAGDLAGAVELMVETWIGPEGDETTRQAVRVQQLNAYEVQLAAEEFDQLRPPYDLAAVRAPSLVVSGAHDLADYRQIAARLPGLLADAGHLELPWAGHLPSMERPAAVTHLLKDFLGERWGEAPRAPQVTPKVTR
ncbi:alpha/beta fold hydrolase [Streptomyces sp. NPDC008139]|uniref:alpha/beta fold hydrolase n=1 Tax=Streptomyces sp. NPDC008139 TaxID=3364814 RepID=UPI0036E2792B